MRPLSSSPQHQGDHSRTREWSTETRVVKKNKSGQEKQEWSRKTTKRSDWHVIKFVAAVMGFALWLFWMEFTSRLTSTLILATTMRFSPHTEGRKLTLAQMNRRWRKRGMNMIKGRWHLRLCRISSIGKAVRRSYPFRSVQFTLVAGSKSTFFVACMGVILSLNCSVFFLG